MQLYRLKETKMITIDVPGLQSNIGIKIALSPSPKKKDESTETKDEIQKHTASDRLAALGLKLMIKDELSDEQKMQLSYNILLAVRKLLNRGKSKQVRDFLLKHKHNLYPELRTLLSEEIKND